MIKVVLGRDIVVVFGCRQRPERAEKGLSGSGYASLGPSNETGITRSTFENKVVGGYVNAVSSAVEERVVTRKAVRAEHACVHLKAGKARGGVYKGVWRDDGIKVGTK
jgi:hypothetical protein